MQGEVVWVGCSLVLIGACSARNEHSVGTVCEESVRNRGGGANERSFCFFCDQKIATSKKWRKRRKGERKLLMLQSARKGGRRWGKEKDDRGSRKEGGGGHVRDKFSSSLFFFPPDIFSHRISFPSSSLPPTEREGGKRKKRLEGKGADCPPLPPPLFSSFLTEPGFFCFFLPSFFLQFSRAEFPFFGTAIKIPSCFLFPPSCWSEQTLHGYTVLTKRLTNQGFPAAHRPHHTNRILQFSLSLSFAISAPEGKAKKINAGKKAKKDPVNHKLKMWVLGGKTVSKRSHHRQK